MRGRSNQGGSALVLAVLTVTVVAALCAGLFQLTTAITKRQSHAVDDMRAFYLAEAGLSEAYFGLTTGMTGQLGSIEAPVLVGDGLVWVDATEEADGLVRLRSTGLCQAGRATLEMVVERVERPLGIFADEGIELSVPFLVDGYDAETSPYYEQATGYDKVVVDPTVEYKFAETADGGFILSYGGVIYNVVDYDLDTRTFWYESTGLRTDTDLAFGTGSDSVSTVDGTTTTDPATTDSTTSTGWGDTGGTGTTELGPTTGVGGMLGSNGPIALSGGGESVEIYGDLVPGVESDVSLGAGVAVTGSVEPRAEPLELDPVTVPEVDMLPGFVHSSAIPRVLPPAVIGYESISVSPGSELVVQGAGSLVVGDLSLEPEGAMTVENAAGAVALYVTNSAQLETGSTVTVESMEPADLSLQAAQTAAALDLRATSQFHGMVYAPDSHVAVGSDFEVFGLLVGNTLEIDPYARLHFDSGVLGNSGAVPLPRFVSWRVDEIPAEVAQSRIDPFQLLQVDKSELEDLTDAHEQGSWFVKIKEYDHGTYLGTYDGPLEQWVPQPNATRAIWYELVPPEEGADGWTLTLDYRKSGSETGLLVPGGGGSSAAYAGSPSGLGLPLWMYEIYELRVDPPTP